MDPEVETRDALGENDAVCAVHGGGRFGEFFDLVRIGAAAADDGQPVDVS